MILAEHRPGYLGYPVNYYELVPHLLNLYPGWTDDDILFFVEEKTGRRVHPEDQITLRAIYRRTKSLEEGGVPAPFGDSREENSLPLLF